VTCISRWSDIFFGADDRDVHDVRNTRSSCSP
jgi:hypothetical protein